MSKLQKKPSALKRGHPTLQNMNFYKFFSTFVGHFCHWPDCIRIQSGSGSGSETLIRGVNILEDARHWIGLLQYNLSTNIGRHLENMII
jgi:hypothetical protein